MLVGCYIALLLASYIFIKNITVLKFFMFVLITFAFCLLFLIVTLSQCCHNKEFFCSLCPIQFRTFYFVYAEAIS